MALTSRTGGQLPCGRRPEDLWDWLEVPGAPDDEHVRGCTHCQTARSSLLALAEATRAAYEDESLSPPPGLRGRIIAAVRAEVRRGDRLPLAAGEFGPVDVSEHAVAVALRCAADTVAGVRARRCRLQPADGASVRVEMSIAIRYSPTTSTRELVEAVRARVTSAAFVQVGLDVAEIDIEVNDVYRDDG